MTTTAQQPLTLPGTSRSGWQFAPAAVREAIEFFGLTSPVEVKLSGGTQRRGCARYRDGVHVITVSTYRDAAGASETLWHELTHAAQREYLGSAAFKVEYARQLGTYGYRPAPFEVEARDTAAAMTAELSLTRYPA